MRLRKRAKANRFAHTGFATYVLRIKLPANAPRLALRVSDGPSSACALYWDATFAAASGIVGKSAATEQPRWIAQTIEVERNDEVRVIVQISNYHHQHGGFGVPVLLGTSEQIFVLLDRTHAAVLARYGDEKLKTIGDSYMCAGGIPVTAGVIGTEKFAYDVWGDAVNIASRMESSGAPGALSISGATYELIRHYFDCQYRGKVMAKGKGEVDMYFLLAKKNRGGRPGVSVLIEFV